MNALRTSGELFLCFLHKNSTFAYHLILKQMNKSLVLSAAIAVVPICSSAEVVYQDANVRIDLISDGAVRLEYTPDGSFIDNKSFVAVERSYPEVNHKSTDKGGWFTVSTKDMELRYKKNSGRFTKDNLKVKSLLPGEKFTWKPGDVAENLKGTSTGLDLLVGDVKDGKHLVLEDGVLTRNGWTLIDDSNNYIFDGSDFEWPQKRKNASGAQDWYLLVYGNDYKKALKDFSLFAGKVPLPPRYAFGFWWSRFWAYSDNELRQLVDDFASYDIPMDVLVLDMDWHHTRKGRGGWSGYSWNRELFPEPAKFLSDMKDRGLKLTLNLHFGSGVPYFEDRYEDMCEWMSRTPAEGDTIQFYTSSKPYMTGLMNKVLRPVENDGCDFWWIDFLDFPYDKADPQLNNLWMLNYVFFKDMESNRDARPIIYNRWGGLGNHRYQVGFSGDHGIAWESLDYQPYFTATAANALHGYWSHDIGGHFKTEHGVEPEMFIRWMQFGTLSPILRTHSAKDAALKKEPWNFDKEHLDIIRNLIKFRYKLAPYIYTMARKTYDDAIALCRPMYYDYPSAEEAYRFKNEYMFGDQMLMQPITAPMQGDFSRLEVWLPAGNQWYEMSSGTLLEGGQTVSRSFALDEYPLYVKAGSVLPFGDGLKNLSDNNLPYQINVFPGGNSTFSLYEDNGNDKEYAQNYARTEIRSEWKGDTLEIAIMPRQGTYEGMPDKRNISLKVNAVRPAIAAFVGGRELSPVYNGYDLSVELPLGELNPESETRVELIFGQGDIDVADGLLGRFKRMRKAMTFIKDNSVWNASIDGILARMETTPTAISYHPENFAAIVSEFNSNYSRMPEILKEYGYDDNIVGKVCDILGI